MRASASTLASTSALRPVPIVGAFDFSTNIIIQTPGRSSLPSNGVAEIQQALPFLISSCLYPPRSLTPSRLSLGCAMKLTLR